MEFLFGILFIFIGGVVFLRIKKYGNIPWSFFVFLCVGVSIVFSFFPYLISYQVSKEIKNSDIIFLLDVSKSMDALDYSEKQTSFSRLEVAKKSIEAIVKKYPENRYGLTIFSGDVSSVIPLTQDASLFLGFLSSIDSASLLSGGNDIIGGIAEVLQRFEAEKTSGGIIVMSDFEFPRFSQSEVQNYYNQNTISLPQNIQVIAVGLGNQGGNRIPIGSDGLFGVNYLRDGFQEVITRYDRQSHLMFQTMTQSEFFSIKNIGDITKIFSKLSTIPTRNFSYDFGYTDTLGRWFGILGYGLFLVYLVLYYLERRKKYNF